MCQCFKDTVVGSSARLELNRIVINKSYFIACIYKKDLCIHIKVLGKIDGFICKKTCTEAIIDPLTRVESSWISNSHFCE